MNTELPIQNVVHPTDFSTCARTALSYAIQMARRHRATLHLLHVGPALNDDADRAADERGAEKSERNQPVTRTVEDQLDVLATAAGADDVDVVTTHQRGVAPGPVIIAYADNQEADLIVMGTHGRRGARRIILGSVAEEVVRQASCSVMTVRDKGDDVAPFPLDRLLVPVDLSEYTKPIFRVACEAADTYGAHLNLLHVVEPLPFPRPLVGSVTIHDLVPDPTERANEQLTQLMSSATAPDVPIDSRVVEGHAAQKIIEQAEALSSNLIMMASHGLSGIEGFLLGSVTARVVRRAPCPVFVVRVQPEE